MASVNKVTRERVVTAEGGTASRIDAVEELKRTVMACLLWEDGFYESGVTIADRIKTLTQQIDREKAFFIMQDAKTKSKLRHTPIWIALALLEVGRITADELAFVVQRPDDLTELIALYWKDGKKPIAKKIKIAAEIAFNSWNEYQLAKYNRKKDVSLRDVMRLCRPKPKDKDQAALFGKLIRDELETPDTWEVALSSGADKRETFERLLVENKLGDLAFLRNLRNMMEANVNRELLAGSFLSRKWGYILPYQFIGAARYAPALEPNIETAMLSCLSERKKSTLSTALLVDVSGSMDSQLSGRSELKRIDAASGLAILAREVYAFRDDIKPVPARRGFALRDAIGGAGGGTRMFEAIKSVGDKQRTDLMIVLTDEQTQDSGSISMANAGLLVIINIAANSAGVGYGKGSVHINGWSESVLDFILEYIDNQ
jgi:hypothetical protein